jgi:NAD(P)-dependent dehydrogenase (short-subunit alcohol dehydrogenase family)
MLIQKSSLQQNSLQGFNVLLTGAGGGIGFEAARALVWLGADVVIAEADKVKGENAKRLINDEMETDRADFYAIDLSDAGQIDHMYEYIKEKYEHIDVVFNNATITPMGAVEDVPIFDWDRSYAVNLRAPVLLVHKFLPDMKNRNTGTIVFVPSSGVAPYMGAYEIFKTAQVELCNTLTAELENTGISTYSIGPGLVRTETAEKAIEKVSSLMGMSTSEFYAMNESHLLNAEAAGTGFAISVVYARQYNGQEIGSIQALIDAGVFKTENKEKEKNFSEDSQKLLNIYINDVVRTYSGQYDGWLKRNIFERQWVLRDFKKTVGFSADQFKEKLLYVQGLSDKKLSGEITEYRTIFEKLQEYYQHQYKLLQGYEKNPELLKENSQIILKWIKEIRFILDII